MPLYNLTTEQAERLRNLAYVEAVTALSSHRSEFWSKVRDQLLRPFEDVPDHEAPNIERAAYAPAVHSAR